MTDVLYASEADLLIGDLQLPASFSTPTYLARATRDVNLALSQVYVTPITSTDQLALDALRNITADLASAYIILSQASGGEDDRPNAYGQLLWNRAASALEAYVSGDRRLPGAELNPASTETQTNPVSVTNEDSQSMVQMFYTYVQQPPPLMTPGRKIYTDWPR